MKKLLSLVLIALLALPLVPTKALAAPTELELEEYFLETGLNPEEFYEYLDFYEWSIDEFESIEEIKEIFGEVLTEERLQVLLDEYEITLEELEALLVEYGDLEEGQSVFDEFIFYDDVYYTATWYLDNTKIDETNLQELLAKYELTYDELVALLEENEDSIDNYDFIEDLDSMVDYYLYYDEEFSEIDETNLKELLKKYELTYDELVALLEENEDSIDNYDYIEDLDSAVDYYLYYDEEFSEIDDLFTTIGFTDEEFENLINHFMTLDFEDPVLLDRLLDLAERMESIGEFDSADDLTAEQIADIMSMFTEMLDLLDLNIKYYLTNGDEKKPINFSTLMTLETTNGYDLLLEVYSNAGTFLADILLTADMFGSEIIEEVGKDLEKVEEVVSKAPTKMVEKEVKEKPKKVIKKTVKGAKLPNTASAFPTNTLIGLLITAFGILLFLRWKQRYAA